ncbi:MAG: hypothetical protein WDW38_006856 [Sanguina aurantia]
MAKRLLHHGCYSAVTSLSSPCQRRVLVRGQLTISQELQEQKQGLHACSCTGIGLGTAAQTPPPAVAAVAATQAVPPTDPGIHNTYTAVEGDVIGTAAGSDGVGVQGARDSAKDLRLQYELVLDASSWAVLEVSGSCCGVAWDPLRCQLCPGAFGLLLHARLFSQQVFCEADMIVLSNSQQPDPLKPRILLSMSSALSGAQLTLPHIIAKLSHDTLSVNGSASPPIFQQTTAAIGVSSNGATAPVPGAHKPIPDHPSRAPAMESLLPSLLQPRAAPAEFLRHLITDAAGFKPHKDPAVVAKGGGHDIRAGATSDLPLYVEGGVMLQGDLHGGAAVDGSCLNEESATTWTEAHTPKAYQSATNKALLATYKAAREASAAAAAGSDLSTPNPTLHGLFTGSVLGSATAAGEEAATAVGSSSGKGTHQLDIISDDSESSWRSRMLLLSTPPDAIAEDGSIIPSRRTFVWPRVAMEAFAMAATVPYSPLAAVSALMRALWLCLHQYSFPARQSRLPPLLQALSRVFLCTSLPTYVARAVVARLTHWHTRVCTTVARRRPRSDEYGVDIPSAIAVLLDHLNVCIQLAADGWDAPHVKRVLSQGALSASSTGSQMSYLCVPSRLHWLQHFHLNEQYIQLACGAQCWSAAVKKLLQLGSRQDVQRGTQFAMAKLSSPASKVDLAVFLLSQVSGVSRDPVLVPGSEAFDAAIAADGLHRAEVPPPWASPVGGQENERGRQVLLLQRSRRAEQQQQPEVRPSLPVSLVLHAAARMALSAARGIVSLPLPGLSELTEVVALRAEQGNFMGLIRSVMAIVCKKLEEERQQQDIAWQEAVSSHQAQQRLDPTPNLNSTPTPAAAASTSHIMMSSAPNQTQEGTIAWMAAVVENAGRQIPCREDVTTYLQLLEASADIRQAVSTLRYPASAQQLFALTDSAAATALAAAGHSEPGALQVGTGDAATVQHPQPVPAAGAAAFDAWGQGAMAAATARTEEEQSAAVSADRSAAGAAAAAAAVAAATAVAAAVQEGLSTQRIGTELTAAVAPAAPAAVMLSTLLQAKTLCLVDDPGALTAFSAELPVEFRDCAAVHSLAVQVVRSQVGSRLALLVGGHVATKADHLEVMDSLDQLLGVFCEDAMLERVQLQAILEVMVAALCTALSSSRTTAVQPMPLGSLALQLARAGQLGLALQVAQCNHRLSNTLKAAAIMLELSIAASPEEQKRSCDSVFENLWRSPTAAPAPVPPAPAPTVGRPVAVVGQQYPLALVLPPDAAGERFAEMWLEEVELEERFEELEAGYGAMHAYGGLRYGLVRNHYGDSDSDSDSDDEEHAEMAEVEEELELLKSRKLDLGVAMGYTVDQVESMAGRELYNDMRARADEAALFQPAGAVEPTTADDNSYHGRSGEDEDQDCLSVDTGALELGETAATARTEASSKAREDEEAEDEELDKAEGVMGGVGVGVRQAGVAVMDQGGPSAGPSNPGSSSSGWKHGGGGSWGASGSGSGSVPVRNATGSSAAAVGSGVVRPNDKGKAWVLSDSGLNTHASGLNTGRVDTQRSAAHGGLAGADLAPAAAVDAVDLTLAAAVDAVDLTLAAAVDAVDLTMDEASEAEAAEPPPPDDLVAVVAASSRAALSCCALGILPDIEFFAVAQHLLLKGLPKDDWATFLACRAAPDTTPVAMHGPEYGLQTPSMTHSRLEVIVAWILAAYSKPEDSAARVTMLQAVASATSSRFGLQLLHLAVAMTLNGLLAEAIPVIRRGLLPRAAVVKVFTEQLPENYGPLYRACLQEVFAALLPDLGGPAQGLIPKTAAAVLELHQIVGELACNLVLLEVPMTQAMLSNKHCVTAVLSMVNILWTKMLAGPQGEVDLFPKPLPPNTRSSYGCLKTWLVQLFVTCVTGPLKLSQPQVQEFFITCVAEMPDSAFSFRLKIPFLQWATHASVPLNTIFPAAKRALREGVCEVATFFAKDSVLFGPASSQTYGGSPMASWLKDKSTPTSGAPMTGAETACRRWVWQLLQWMTSKLGEAIPETAGTTPPPLQQQPTQPQQQPLTQQLLQQQQQLLLLQQLQQQQQQQQQQLHAQQLQAHQRQQQQQQRDHAQQLQQLQQRQQQQLAQLQSNLSMMFANQRALQQPATAQQLQLQMTAAGAPQQQMQQLLQLQQLQQQQRQQLLLQQPQPPGTHQPQLSQAGSGTVNSGNPAAFPAYTPEMLSPALGLTSASSSPHPGLTGWTGLPVFTMAGELVAEVGSFCGPELLPVAAAVLRLTAASALQGPGHNPWGVSGLPDGLLLLSRSILPLCGSWRRLNGGFNVAWDSSAYRDTLRGLVTSCSQGATKLPPELMVNLALTLFYCSPDYTTLMFVNKALMRAGITTASASAQPLIVPDPDSKLNPPAESMLFLHSTLTPHLMAMQPGSSDTAEAGLIRLLQIQILAPSGVGASLDLLLQRPAGMSLSKTTALWMAVLNHLLSLPSVYKLLSPHPCPTLEHIFTCLGMEPRFTPAAVRPGHRKDTWQEAKVAVASFPGVNLAVHLIHVEHWSRTVLHGQGGVGAVLLRKDAATLSDQRSFVADLGAIFNTDEATAAEIITSQERSLAPGAKEFLIYGREALQLGTLPALSTAMGEAVRDNPRFSMSTVNGTKATKALEIATYLIQNRASYIESMANRYSSVGAARFAGHW